MIPFTGTSGLKQFVKGKLNPGGSNNFVDATPDALVLDFETYQGKQTFLDQNSKKNSVSGPPLTCVYPKVSKLDRTFLWIIILQLYYC